MKTLAIILILVGAACAQNRTMPPNSAPASMAPWLRFEDTDEINGRTLMYLLPAEETPARGKYSYRTDMVMLMVACRDGNPMMSFAEFREHLHIEDTDSDGKFRTDLVYRANNQAVYFSARLSDSGTQVHSDGPRDVGGFKVLMGHAVRVETVTGDFRVYHFPNASSSPFETGGCR
jgi:hypothetical protein